MPPSNEANLSSPWKLLSIQSSETSQCDYAKGGQGRRCRKKKTTAIAIRPSEDRADAGRRNVPAPVFHGQQAAWSRSRQDKPWDMRWLTSTGPTCLADYDVQASKARRDMPAHCCRARHTIDGFFSFFFFLRENILAIFYLLETNRKCAQKRGTPDTGPRNVTSSEMWSV